MRSLRTRRPVLAGAAVLALATLAAGPLQAQPVSATSPPAVGSAQRRAILDAIRPAVEAQLGPDIEFLVRRIRVIGGWAFVMADPQRRGGRPIDGRRYFPHFDRWAASP